MIPPRVVCPVDFSAFSHEALLEAARLSGAQGAELTVLHVWDVPDWARGPQVSTGEVDAARRRAEQTLTDWCADIAKLGLVEPRPELLAGRPWDQIVAMARSDSTIELLVMGAYGHTARPRGLTGAVTDKVVRHAPCSVLVVRQRLDLMEVPD